jgi:uncharacterized protein (AIM24 family)
LSYKIAASTSQSQGFLGNLVNSVTSGDGVVLRFSGKGKIVLCSRNRDTFLKWFQSRASS